MSSPQPLRGEGLLIAEARFPIKNGLTRPLKQSIDEGIDFLPAAQIWGGLLKIMHGL